MIDSATLEYLRPGITFGPGGSVALIDRGNGGGVEIDRWDDPRPIPDAAELDAAHHAAHLAGVVDAIKRERDRREAAGFPYLGRVIDSDARSVQRISIAATAAAAAMQFSAPFDVEWTCADNSTLPLNAQGVLGMPVALAQYAMALHMHGRALQAAAAAAADPLAFDITAGWPD